MCRPVCPQARPVYSCPPSKPMVPGSPQPPSAEQLESELPQDEFNCLNLNITCPRRAAASASDPGLPVMLWIHG